MVSSDDIKSRLNSNSESEIQHLFQQGISDLMSEIVSMLHEASSLELDSRLTAYETIISKTASVLKWINSQTSLRYSIDREQLKRLEDQKRELENKWEKLLIKAAQLKKENDQLRKKNSGGNSTAAELASLMLGIPQKSSVSEIKKAYRERAKKVHPDKKDGDEQIFKALTEAMLILVKQSE